MSTTIDAVTPLQSAGGSGPGAVRVIQFDATARRREKMRERSSNDGPAESPAPARPPVEAANGFHPSVAPAANGTPVAPASAPAPVVAPAPVAPAAAPAPAASTGAAGMDQAELEQFLISFVVEQTGYPEEMVELDADLEADLGIDSIKKAQLFGELAEHFEIQVTDVTELSLDDFPTLVHVRDFLQSNGSPAAGSSPAAPAAAAVNGATASTNGSHVPQAATNGAATNGAANGAANLNGATNGSHPATNGHAHVAPVQTAPAPAAPVAAPAPAAAGSGMPQAELEQFLISFVVEQTGYPEEMVELDADLEADLGIDSIKKAQLFGELAEHFEIQVTDVTELSLDDFPTLAHVRDFLQTNGSPAGAASAPAAEPSPVAAPAAVPAPVAAPAPVVARASVSSPLSMTAAAPAATEPAPAGDASPELEEFLVNFVVEQTGYPEEMVELDADLEADLGIDSIKKAQMFGELAEHFEIQMNDVSEMSLDDFPTLRHVLGFLASMPRRTAA